MKLFQAWLLTSLWTSVLAAPAVVWKRNSRQARALQSSESIEASELMGSVLQDLSPSESSLSSVVFLVKKGEDGSESLTELASNGKLPETSNKYSDATGVYHHVASIESPSTMVRECGRANHGQKVLQVSLAELNTKLAAPSADTATASIEVEDIRSKSAKKRAKDLGNADVLVVVVHPNEEDMDQSIARTIENENVESVVLTAVRSIDEVKRERASIAQKRHDNMMIAGERHMDARRRRLDEAQGDDNNNNNNNGDMSGVYYVYMTPNILSGLLFGFMFATVTFIGIQCMASIASQDVYVNKMPAIGREA
ncbi:MAG: hypothetical protein SGBAC_009295 [Bacillariaceae sp.]